MLQIPTSAFPDQLPRVLRAPTPVTDFATTLLDISSAKQPAGFVWVGVCVYCAAVFALMTFDFNGEPLTLEAPIEMVYEEAAAEPEPAQPEPPPPVPEVQPTPPPPIAEAPPEPPPPPPVEEAAEPVVEPPPPLPTKVEPVKQQEPPPKSAEPPREKIKPRASVARTVGAVPSDYANKVYQRINRIASGSFPKMAGVSKPVRVSYVVVIGQAGQLISKSISSSGVPAADAAAAEALRRASPFPPPPALGAASYRMSGAIVYKNR